MASRDLKRSADRFMVDCLDPLREAPFSDISSWPEYLAVRPMPLDVPEVLSNYTFTLMKGTLPTGEIRVAIQRYRSRLLGITAEVTANGFVLAPNRATQPLNQQEIWDLT